MKLQTKIISYVSSVLVTLVLSIAVIVFWVIQPARLEQLMQATMLKVAGSVEYEMSSYLRSNDASAFVLLAQRLSTLEDVYGIALYDQGGTRRFSSKFHDLAAPNVPEDISQAVYQERRPLFRQETTAARQQVLSLYYPLSSEQQQEPGMLKLTFTFDSLHQYRRESITASLIACAIGLVVLVLLVYSLLAHLFQRIQAVTFKMNTIIRAQDLTQRVNVEQEDEIGDLGNVFNRMVERLLRVTKEIQGAGLRVTSSTEQIVQVAKSQLETSEHLINSVQEAQTAVEALKASSGQISEKAASVLTNAEHTLINTERSEEVAEELVSDMVEVETINREGVQQIHSLTEKAYQINEIVAIIEEITSTTKLIAFNATIEAARAGEAGKGFSVVAEEIRNLADSVGVATSNIRQIILDMQDATSRSADIETRQQKKIEHGLQSVKRTKEHLDAVLDMLNDTVNHAREIAHAAEEQKTSTTDLFDKIEQFFQIAQETKTGSARASSSAKELDRLAEGMQQTVERFKLE